MPVENQGFPKSCRLLDSSAYEDVFNKPDFRISNKYILILGCKTPMGSARLGVIVAKKNVARATARNRVKRVIREAFRTTKILLPSCDLVVLSRKGLDSLDNEKCRACINELLEEIKRKHSTE
jgi:ribonuclease P protein component